MAGTDLALFINENCLLTHDTVQRMYRSMKTNDDIEMLNSMAIGSGKTFAICEAAKKIGATVVTHNRNEARRIAKEYQVKAVSLCGNIRGTTGPYLVDTQAVSEYSYRKNREIAVMQAQLVVMRDALESIQRGMGDEGSSEQDWQGLDHHVLRNLLADIFTEARQALAALKDTE